MHEKEIWRNAEEESRVVDVEERVLADMAHEMGNFFHRLYYWSDYLRNGGPEKSAVAVIDMLERTIKHMEEFMQTFFDYLSPAAINLTSVRGDHLLASLGACLKDYFGEEEVTIIPTAADRHDLWVRIDPLRIAKTFQIACKQIKKQLKSSVVVDVKVGKVHRWNTVGVEIRVHFNGREIIAWPIPMKGVEWAVVKKFIEMHGGEIIMERDAAGAALAIFLPLHAE